MNRSVGILGGTLDPIHKGHTQIALEVLRRLSLDQMLLLPAGDPPHKRGATEKNDRLRMTELAAQCHTGLTVCPDEIERDGTTYTVETLTALHAREPETRWFYIIGADTLNVVDQWRDFPKIARLCTFVVVGRPGGDADLAARAAELRIRYNASLLIPGIDGPSVSSTEVRERVAKGQPIDKLVDPPVEKYIRENGLYLCDYSKARLKEMLSQALKPARFTHTLGVAETAKRFAPRYGVDPERAYLAGLLHDCAKYMPEPELRALVTENVPDADEAELAFEAVLHAPAGSVLARTKYGVKDESILRAIRRHTLGDAHMTALDAILYVADYIEPNRKHFEGLDKARAVAERDIFEATRLCAEMTASFVKSFGGTPHPRSIQMIQNLRGGTLK